MFQQKINVVLADGRELTAVADQRDLAAAEAQFPEGVRMHTHVRFLAWSALSRALQIAMPWEKFNKSECVEAADPKPDEVEALDPTQPGQSGESS
jgi:hypothetical protein